MPDAQVKITADTRGLKDVQSAADAAFSPKAVIEFNRRVKELEADMRRLGKDQADLAQGMRGVERGSEAYDKMKKRLRDVGDEIRLVGTALKGLSHTQDEIDRRDRAREVSRRGFVGGFAQGAGVGQYIPTDAGQAPWIAGSLLGGMAHRAGSAAYGGFLTPGIGTFAGMLGAIPGIGGAAQSLFQSAGGFYQQAIGYDQSQLAIAPYLSPSARRTRTRTEEIALPPEVEETRRKNDALTMAYRRADRDYSLSVDTLRREAEAARGTLFEQEVRDQLKWAIAREHEPQEGTAAGGERLDEPDAIKRAPQFRTIKSSYTINPGMPYLGWGASMGYSPMEEAGLISGFMGARGGTFDSGGDTRNSLVEAAAAQRVWGIPMGLAGAYGRGFTPTGGMGHEAGGETSLTRTMSVLVDKMGLHGALAVEALQTLVSQEKEIEQTGIKIKDGGNIRRSMELAGALGLEGGQASRVGGEMMRAVGGFSSRGVTSPLDVLIAQAHGWDPTKGTASLFSARERASHRDPQAMQQLMASIVLGARQAGQGQDPVVARGHARDALSRMGINVGDYAQTIMDSFDAEGNLTPEAQKRLSSQPGGIYSMVELQEEASRRAGTTGSLAVGAAGRQGRQISAGRDIAPTMGRLEDAGIKMVQAVTNFEGSFKKAADVVFDFATKVESLTEWLNKMGANGNLRSVNGPPKRGR